MLSNLSRLAFQQIHSPSILDTNGSKDMYIYYFLAPNDRITHYYGYTKEGETEVEWCRLTECCWMIPGTVEE
jgi:hypothetical protein